MKRAAHRGAGPGRRVRPLAAALVLLAGLPAPALPDRAAWHEPHAVFRMDVDRVAGSPWPATCGELAFCAGALDPLRCELGMRTPDGRPVGVSVVWASPGRPLRLLFDTSSGDETYVLYAGGSIRTPVPGWTPEAGLLLETRGSDAPPVESVTHFRRAWAASRDVQGRRTVPRIHYGLNPLGPPTRYLARYAGYFSVPEEGVYRLATVSDDASFVLVDGREVAGWPGEHGVAGGRLGEHAGSVRLAAGRHTIEYLHAQGAGDTYASLAWRPPGRDRFEIVPAKAFPPVARFEVAGAVTAEGARTVPFAWRTESHLFAGGRALVQVALEVVSPDPSVVYRWTLDDGTVAEGPAWTHWFLRPGLRGMRLEALAAGRRPAAAAGRIDAAPLWDERVRWSGERFAGAKPGLLERPLDGVPLADLVHYLRWIVELDDLDLLRVAGAELLRRVDALPAGDLDLLPPLGTGYADPSVRDYARAEAAERALLARGDADPALAARARLRLARLLLDVRGDAAAAEAAAGAGAAWPDGASGRAYELLRADLLLARGDADAAYRAYLALTPAGSLRDRRLAARRRADLEYAGDLIRREEWDPAARKLEQVRREQPVERMAPDIGLALARAMLGRGEVEKADQLGRRLLPVAVRDDDRAGLLYLLAETGFALGRAGEAVASLARLAAGHRYSEAAARARDRWPGYMP